MPFAIVDIEGVCDGSRIEAVAHQRGLGVLEGGRDFQIVPDAEEDRPRGLKK